MFDESVRMLRAASESTWVPKEELGQYLSQLFSSKLSIGLCPLDFPRIALHLEVLVTLAPAKSEDLHKGCHSRCTVLPRLHGETQAPGQSLCNRYIQTRNSNLKISFLSWPQKL